MSETLVWVKKANRFALGFWFSVSLCLAVFVLLLLFAAFSPSQPFWLYALPALVLSAAALWAVWYGLWYSYRGVRLEFGSDGLILLNGKPNALRLDGYKGIASAYCPFGRGHIMILTVLVPKSVYRSALVLSDHLTAPVTWKGETLPLPDEVAQTHRYFAERLNLHDYGFIGLLSSDEDWHFVINRLPKDRQAV